MAQTKFKSKSVHAIKFAKNQASTTATNHEMTLDQQLNDVIQQ